MRRRAFLLAGLALLPASAVASGKPEKKTTGGDSYLAVPPLAGTTLRNNGRRGVMTVQCGLDVPDERLRELAMLSLPRLRAAYAQTVQTYAAGLLPGAAPNADFLSRALQRQTDLALGRPGARLLLGAIIIN